jgi:hypothetical protein
MTGQLDIFKKTLLNKNVKSKHATALKNKLNKKWNKIKKLKLAKTVQTHQIAIELGRKIEMKNHIQSPEHTIANSHIRFFTLIDSVCLIDVNDALNLVNDMKNELIETVRSTKGIGLIGSIEVEVAAVNKMYQKSKLILNPKDSSNKYETIKVLAEEANLTKHIAKLDATFFLIHFHGVVFANSKQYFLKLEQKLKSNPRWNKAKRQILLSPLSEKWGNKCKSVEANLKHIADYITKGAILRYKCDKVSDEDFIAYFLNSKNISPELKTLLKNDELEDGVIEDSMGLTIYEISELTKLIFNIMNSNETMTGYLLEVNI